MSKVINLITTPTYYSVFDKLVECLKDKTSGLDEKNLVFCEEKVSLMAERKICSCYGGTFNTDVCSFGKFLRKFPNYNDVEELSKESAVMAIKLILLKNKLEIVSDKGTGTSQKLFELIMQLKSSKISEEDVFTASNNVKGILQRKLKDIYTVYSEYEKFLDGKSDLSKDKKYCDQSSVFDRLPELIKNDRNLNIEESNVYFLGYTSFTRQALNIVKELTEKAKSVTVILTDGANGNIYTGETVNAIKSLCTELNLKLEHVDTDATLLKGENAIISNKLFACVNEEKKTTDKIKKLQGKTVREEIEKTAKIIKGRVLRKEARYYDFTIAIPDVNKYRNYIEEIFGDYEIPYFLDERKKPKDHPLIRLIVSYMDTKIKNFEPTVFSEFYKNPLVLGNKNFTDGFENYLKKYNVKFNGIKEKLPCEKNENEKAYTEYEKFRKELLTYFEHVDVKNLLNGLDVEKKLEKIANATEDKNEAQVNKQIYKSVSEILDGLEKLSSNEITLKEKKSLFLSGVEGLELSVIPQCKDGVFIGEYREASLCKANTLFMLGLTGDVPVTQNDVALLTDSDIETSLNALEPKIDVVNRRTAENVGVCCISFEKELFLSCPSSEGGKNTSESLVISDMENLFDVKRYKSEDEMTFYTKKQGFNQFAKLCFIRTENQNADNTDFNSADLYYFVLSGGSVEDKQKLQSFIERFNRSESKLLNVDLSKDKLSPTTFETFYSCPYQWFAKSVLKLNETETGEVDGKLSGNFLHDIIKEFEKEINNVSDKNQTDIVVEKIAKELKQSEKYKRFSFDLIGNANIERITQTAKDVCDKIREQNKNSDLIINMEMSEQISDLFEINGTLIRGKPDRIDEGDDCFTVIDYKSGQTDLSPAGLYYGNKLQLFIYSFLQVKGKDDINKMPVGVYYCLINGEYGKEKENFLMEGVTVKEEEFQNKIIRDKQINKDGNYIHIPTRGNLKPLTIDELFGCREYAKIMVRNAIDAMKKGLIAPIPIKAVKGPCAYCKFGGMCGKNDDNVRQVESGIYYKDFQTIINAENKENFLASNGETNE